MGRYDFSPQRVHRAVTHLREANRIPVLPPWYGAVGTYPPSERLVRPALQRGKGRPGRASRMFKPIEIKYPEDKLRDDFFNDHPWELARPRTVLESDGKDYQRQNWEGIDHTDRPLNGESVVQRQIWLMNNRGLAKNEAYDKARKELYQRREREAVMQRIAREEALYVGAEFGKSAVQVGVDLEDKSFEEWRTWANKEVEVMRQVQGSQYSGADVNDTDLVADSQEDADAELDQPPAQAEQARQIEQK